MINKEHQTERTAYIMVPFIGNPRGKKKEGAKLSGQKTDQLYFLGWWKCFLHHYFSGTPMNVDIC